jgi:hypothetical protein
MIFCAECLKEMKCARNGAQVGWAGGHHVYRGDRYECDICNANVIVCNSHADYFPKPIQHDDDINFIAREG